MNTQTRRSAAQRIAIILAVIVQIGSTFLPVIGMGENIGERSDEARTWVTPAGFAFAIWGPLFLGSIIYALWQALPAQRDNTLLDKIGWASVIALAAQGVWAIYTQSNALTFISTIIILTSLVALLYIVRVLVAFERPFTLAERTIVAITFSALAAWLTAASIVNITASLTYHGIGATSGYPLLSAAVVMTGGIIVTIATARSRGNPWYALVFCWALYGIYSRGGQESDTIALATLVSAILVIGAVAIGLKDKDNRYHWFG